jgi:hypothetical protein
VNRLHGNAMVDGSGMAYQPPTVEDARRIEIEHGARIASDTFAWPCAEMRTWWRDGYALYPYNSQCTRVAGHEGEHRGEVTW